MKVTTLVENSPHVVKSDLQAEHGLSFYIEHDGFTIMSDVGQSGKFAANAARLGVDLTRVEGLVISHHHYDHGGGLAYFFRENDSGTVYLRPSPEGDQVAVVLSLPLKYIGLDKNLLAEHANRIVYVDENLEISPGLHLLTNIPDVYAKPSGDQRLKVRQGSNLMPDTFEHELVTVVEMADALVVLTGCAHNGVLNMIEAVHKALPKKPIQAVIGGFHLGHETGEKIIEIGETLLSLGIPEIYTGHCTGEKAVGLLEQVLGDRLHRLYTGLEIEI